VPANAVRGHGLVAAAVPDLLAGHLADLAPANNVRDRGPAVASAAGLSVRHGPLRATRGRGPVAIAGLWWTCGPDSSAGDQR
jgi:hypothetical protein